MPSTAVSPDLKGYKFTDYRDGIWGDSYNWDFTRSLDQVVKLVIHHTVTSHDATPDYIAQLHKARGWAGIGYHFLVSYSGEVWYVGDIGTGRANVMNNNEKVIGISLIGDFTKELPSAHQILATNRLCEYFMTKYPALKNINTWDDVWGHKDCVAWAGSEATQCPSSAWKTEGDNLFTRLKTANYNGYPDWQSAKGVEVPVPPVTPIPTPPPAPVTITDPTTRIDCGKYGVLELRKVVEMLTTTENDMLNLRQELYNKSVMLEMAGRIITGKGWPWQKIKGLKILMKL